MAVRGDIKRARSVKAEIDDKFEATSHGGAVLYEKLLRATDLRHVLGEHLPQRKGKYTSAQAAEQIIVGLMLGGKGYQATTLLRNDSELARIFGYDAVADDATVYRVLCELAGLEQRKFAETYRLTPERPAALDVFGAEKRKSKHERIVGEAPERMAVANQVKMNETLRQYAVKCGQKLPAHYQSVMGFRVHHGDATGLEVSGQCFDAAEFDHNGNRSLRALTVSSGPLHVAVDLQPGASDEGKHMVPLLEQAKQTFDLIHGRSPMLGLYDAAYAEARVANKMKEFGWKYIICANQWRGSLERKLSEFDEKEWIVLKPDPTRGWARNEVTVFRHQPEGWNEVVRVIVRRWQNDDELGIWHYSFLYTNLAPEELSNKERKQYGYCQLVWMLYSTKQGHENTYKTLLSDLGQHHPVSGRMGATQALLYLAAMAANAHAVMSHRVVAAPERGIRLWRFVRDYVQIAGKVIMRAGNTLTVCLAGGSLPTPVKELWLKAYGNVCQL
jgi:hypothetical protein